MLNVNIMGLKCENPVVVSAGPWTRGSEKIREAFESGAGAIVTETIVSEPYPDTSPRYAYNRSNGGVQNIRLYSGLNLEGWLREFEQIRKMKKYGYKTLLVASIMASTPSELGYIAKKVEKSGVDAIEIGFSCPMGEGPEILGAKEDMAFAYTKEVVKSVSIPVSVKLSQNTSNLVNIVKAVERAGASGISAIDTVRCILSIDVETGRPGLPTYGGYSGAPIRPLALAVVASVAQTTRLPLLGIGGIENHVNLLEHMMAGASAGAVGTAILLGGYRVIGDILKNLTAWMDSHGIKSLDEVRGLAVKELRSFEEIKTEPKKAQLVEKCGNRDCLKCVYCCIDNAMEMTVKGIQINSAVCTGCGLCLGVCPEKRIALDWK